MNLKKILALTSFITTISSSSFAHFNGFQIGVHGGGSLLTGTHTYTNGSSNIGKQTVKAPGIAGGLQAAYLKVLGQSNAVLGLELYGTYFNANTKKDIQIDGRAIEGKVDIHHQYAIGAALIGGMVINPKMFLYGKMGYETNRFSLEYQQLTFQSPTAEKYTKSTRGLVPGVGILFKMSPRFLVGTEYNYSFMKKIELRSDTESKNNAKRGFTYTPNEHRIFIKASYLF